MSLQNLYNPAASGRRRSAGFTLGDCRKLDGLLSEGVDTARFPVLGLLMEEDLKGLLALARERRYQESAEGFYSKCHLCMDLRK